MFDLANDSHSQRLLMDIARLIAKYADLERDLEEVKDSVVAGMVVSVLTTSPAAVVGPSDANKNAVLAGIQALAAVSTALGTVPAQDKDSLVNLTHDWGMRLFFANR